MQQLRSSFADLHLDGNMKQPVADSIMKTIVQLVLKSIWHAELGAFSDDSEIEQDSDTQPQHGFVCLLKNCGIIILSKGYQLAQERLRHMADKHAKEIYEDLTLSFFYSDSTDIGRSQEFLVYSKIRKTNSYLNFIYLSSRRA